MIERDWYEILTYALDEIGHCEHCGAAIAGRFGHFGTPFGPRWTPKTGHQWTPENRPPRKRCPPTLARLKGLIRGRECPAEHRMGVPANHSVS